MDGDRRAMRVSLGSHPVTEIDLAGEPVEGELVDEPAELLPIQVTVADQAGLTEVELRVLFAIAIGGSTPHQIAETSGSAETVVRRWLQSALRKLDTEDIQEAARRAARPAAPVAPANPAPPAKWKPRGKAAEALAGRLGQVDPLGGLSAAAAEMYELGLNENTTQTYEYQWLRVLVWLGETEHVLLPEPGESQDVWWPRAARTLVHWIADNYTMTRADGKLRGRKGQPYAPDTVRLSLWVVSRIFRRRGLASPVHHPDVQTEMKGYGKKWKRAGFKEDAAESITPAELLAMLRTCDLNTVSGLRDAALMRIATECGRRNSELMALNWTDLTFLTPTSLRVNIPFSKTNQTGKGDDNAYIEADMDRWIGDQLVRAWAPEFDPLLLLREHREVCAGFGYDVTRGPVWRKCHGGGVKRADGTRSGVVLEERMTRKNYQDVVAAAARRSGVLFNPVTGEVRKIVPHSLRVYLVTEGSKAGVPLGVLCDQGGWSRKSPVVLGYQRQANRLGEDNPGVQIRTEVMRRQKAAEKAQEGQA